MAFEPADGALPEAPIQLISVADDGTFSVGEQAKAILRQLGLDKICVVAVAGLYRTGKSSLSNFLLGQNRGFEVGPATVRCTRGVWMWGRPHRTTLPSGEAAWVVLLDMEGLGGLEADRDYDLRLFSLATLLCSTLLYNSLGTIDENAIASLSFVAQLARHIRISPANLGVSEGSGGEGEQGEQGGQGEHGNQDEQGEQDGHDADADAELEATQFGRYFPSFAWVLRDFALDLVDEYGAPLTPDEYLERSLRPQVGFDEVTAERNRIRDMLSTFFCERKCFTLVRPLADEAQLQEIDKVPLSELRDEFREQLDELKDYLYFQHLRPKVVNNVALNGSSFIGLAEQYINAIASGGVPTITSAWQEVMHHECEGALRESLDKYDEEFSRLAATRSEAGAVENDVLVERHARSLKRAVALFQRRAGGDEAGAYREQLEARLVERFRERAKRNADRSAELCAEALKALHEAIVAPRLGDGDQAYHYHRSAEGPYASLQADLNVVRARYRAAPLATGPAKGAALAQYYDEQVLQTAVQGISRRVEADRERRARADREQAAGAGAAASLEAQKEACDESTERARREALDLRTDKLRLEAAQQASETRVSQLLALLQAQTEQISELKSELREYKETIESEQQWQTTLSDKLENLQVAHDEKSAEFGKLKSADEQLCEKLGELEKSVSHLESKQASLVKAREQFPLFTSLRRLTSATGAVPWWVCDTASRLDSES